MKSIKEKAEEYTSVIENQVTNNAAFLAYKSGANYVLDAIIECLPKTHSFNPNEVINIIASRIKELKSNQ